MSRQRLRTFELSEVVDRAPSTPGERLVATYLPPIVGLADSRDPMPWGGDEQALADAIDIAIARSARAPKQRRARRR